MKQTAPATAKIKLPSSSAAQAALTLYRFMYTARQVDLLEAELTQRGEAFFHVSGAGHEATAALATCLGTHDWLHCHYRDKALLLARGLTPETFFLSLLCKAGSHSEGRQMSAHLSDPALHVLSMVGPVGNNALQAVGVAAAVKGELAAPVVLCALGDGTTQQGEVLEAIAEAVRSTLPVLFLVEDNKFAISTLTAGQTFFETPAGTADQFYGVPIHRADGRRVAPLQALFAEVVGEMRTTRGPAIIVLEVDRLANHTNADDQTLYRSAEAITEARELNDPVAIYRNELLESGVAPEDLDVLETALCTEVRAAAERARRAAEPAPIFTASAPMPAELADSKLEYRGNTTEPRLTMLQALREVLRHQLAADPRVVLFGEDIEDPKGDVFGLTRGLTEAFPGQVRNSPLAESTIVGTAIGRALAGQRPVAFLQFADFLPIAFNQIISELGSMWWRTAGGWQAPVIVMITCGGYRPGLGPFHAQTLEAIAAHTPGVDVVMPATAADAAGLLNTAFASGRPTLFFYPKSCLNDRGATTSTDIVRQRVPLGVGRITRAGRDLSLVGYGNALGLCHKAADALELAGFSAEVIDLRTVQPWDQELVYHSARKTSRLIVVHEDNHTCGMGAEILATVAERAGSDPTAPAIRLRRLTRADTYVPCNFGNQLQVLPSYRRILETAADLLGCDVSWEQPPPPDPNLLVVEAVGSSPSDESVIVIEWLIKPEQRIATGQTIATLEADKALVELSAPAAGVVRQLLVAKGEMVKVGMPLLSIAVEEPVIPKPATQEQPGTPTLHRRKAANHELPAAVTTGSRAAGLTPLGLRAVGLSNVVGVKGSRQVSNSELTPFFDAWTDEDIVRRTGIESRCRAGEDETVLTLATQAAQQLLRQEQLSVADLDAVIVATGTPLMMTPSLACLLLNELAQGSETRAAAWDVNAACSGYLYALHSAFDLLQSQPDARVLVVTAEVVSPLLDPADFGTSIIFGDAASATMVYGESEISHARARLLRPELSAKGEDGRSICVPLRGSGRVHMDGQRVFSEAVRKMINMLERVCLQHELDLETLDLIIPHQANQRIMDAIRSRIKFPEEKIYTNIRHIGNTSSSSIPLCLTEVFPQRSAGERIGLCAFGGGFTFAAGILEVL
jgi:2-oxoisovalerate dehydrogenase E1 component